MITKGQVEQARMRTLDFFEKAGMKPIYLLMTTYNEVQRSNKGFAEHP